MNKTINVLVTGVGAIIGYGILKSLRNSKYTCNLIGIDIFNDAVGQQWCDKFIQGIRADSDDFIDFINSIVNDEQIDIVIPGIEQDIEKMVKNFADLSSSSKYVLNNREMFDIFHDKKQTYIFLEKTIDLIPSLYFEENLFETARQKFSLPFIMKQNISYASKGVASIDNEQEYNSYIDTFGSECVAQKKLNIIDSEFTCSIFGLGDGQFVNPICLQRELSVEGSTKKGINIAIDNELQKTLQAICKKSNFIGPTNLQFIKYNGKYLLLEINARISSSTSIREIFGVNEAEMCIDYYLLNQTPSEIKQRQGTVVRYIEDAYFDSNSI